MAKKIVEINQEVVKVRSRIDGYVEEVKAIDADIAEFEALYHARLEEMKEAYESKVMNLKANRERIMANINGLFDLAEAKESKTQQKLTLLSGDVVRKKSQLKYKPDKAALTEWAKMNDPELVRTKVSEEIAWDSLKERLVMQQGLDGSYSALDTLTGEILQCVEVIEEAQKTEVK